jgi:hypothetical protein
VEAKLNDAVRLHVTVTVTADERPAWNRMFLQCQCSSAFTNDRFDLSKLGADCQQGPEFRRILQDIVTSWHHDSQQVADQLRPIDCESSFCSH